MSIFSITFVKTNCFSDIQNRDAVHVYNLEGSIFKWANENRPMVDVKDKATIYAHPYNAVFQHLLRKELRLRCIEEVT